MELTESQHHDAFAAFERAVAAAGSQSELARQVGCTPANIGQLLRSKSLLSGRFVLKAEAATGISRHELRPDLYPLEDTQPARHTAEQPPAESPTPAAGGSSSGAEDGTGIEGIAA